MSGEQDVLLTELMFLIYICICDSDRMISSEDADKLQRLVAKPHWARSDLMRRTLITLKTAYANMWFLYEKTEKTLNAADVSAHWDAICLNANKEEIPDLSEDLRAFVTTLTSTPSGSNLDEAERRTELHQSIHAVIASVPSYSVAAQVPDRTGTFNAAAPAPTERACAADSQPLIGMDHRAAVAPWSGGVLSCVEVILETADVKTYTFRAEPPAVFSYKPGQAMVLTIPIEGKPVRRSYSISSSPSRPYTIDITVKRIAGGVVSNWLFDKMHLGMMIEAKAPFGRLTHLDYPTAKLLLVSGGSGVTPMMSMLRSIYDSRTFQDVVFINNVRSPLDIIFEHELHFMSSRLGDALTLGIVPSRIALGRPWNGPVGRFDGRLLQVLAPDFRDREAFVCGPTEYMAHVRTVMDDLGFPMDRFHQESFGTSRILPDVGASTEIEGRVPLRSGPSEGSDVPMESLDAAKSLQIVTADPRPFISLASEPQTLAPRSMPRNGRDRDKVLDESRKLDVTFAISGKTVICSYGELLLDVAERNGVALDSSCRTGACGTCKVKTLDGMTSMDDCSGLAEEDFQDGFVLSCMARVHSALVVHA